MRKAVSIRRSLMTNLAVVGLTLGVAIVVMMALSTRRIIQTRSESLIHQTSRRTELKLRTFFEPVSNQINSLRGWGESGELDIDAIERLPYILRELLEEFPHSSAVYLADESDREIFLTRQGSNWMRRDLDVGERGGVAAITEWIDG